MAAKGCAMTFKPGGTGFSIITLGLLLGYCKMTFCGQTWLVLIIIMKQTFVNLKRKKILYFLLEGGLNPKLVSNKVQV